MMSSKLCVLCICSVFFGLKKTYCSLLLSVGDLTRVGSLIKYRPQEARMDASYETLFRATTAVSGSSERRHAISITTSPNSLRKQTPRVSGTHTCRKKNSGDQRRSGRSPTSQTLPSVPSTAPCPVLLFPLIPSPCYSLPLYPPTPTTPFTPPSAPPPPLSVPSSVSCQRGGITIKPLFVGMWRTGDAATLFIFPFCLPAARRLLAQETPA